MAVAITVPILGTFHDAAYFQQGELNSTDLFELCYTDGTHAYPVATINAIRATGKGILANHENAQAELAGGATAGQAAAIHAVTKVLPWGMPSDGSCAIVYSVDLNVPNRPASFEPYAEAFVQIRAVHGGRFKVGYYGELALYKYLNGLGLLDVKCILSASSSYPGYNPNDPDVGAIQLVGTDIASTDRDLVTSYDLGVWWVEGHDPSGGGQPIPNPVPPLPIPEDDPMWSDAAIFTVGDGPATGDQFLLLPNGVYLGVQHPTESKAYQALGAKVPPGDANGANLTGAGHRQLLAASPNYPYNNMADPNTPMPPTASAVVVDATAIAADLVPLLPVAPTAQQVAGEVLDEEADRLQS